MARRNSILFSLSCRPDEVDVEITLDRTDLHDRGGVKLRILNAVSVAENVDTVIRGRPYCCHSSSRSPVSK